MNPIFAQKYDIKSENSSDHWKYFNCVGKVVLDLGCGRWDVTDHQELSPVYFLKNGAKEVIGIDGSQTEIEYFKANVTDENAEFHQANISTKEDLINLINAYGVEAIKCDIEGSETAFFNFTKEDFAGVDTLAIEYHSADIFNRLVEFLPTMGFTLETWGRLWVPGMGVVFATTNPAPEPIKNKPSIVTTAPSE